MTTLMRTYGQGRMQVSMVVRVTDECIRISRGCAGTWQRSTEFQHPEDARSTLDALMDAGYSEA